MKASFAALGRAADKAIPAAGWLPSWRLTLKRDTLAALAVWAVLVPQAMAYAELAGVPPVRGCTPHPPGCCSTPSWGRAAS